MTPRKTEKEQAANAFAGLFDFIIWVKKHLVPLLLGGSLVGGGTTVLNRCTDHAPVNTQKVTVNGGASDSLIKELSWKVDMVAQGVGTNIAMTSILRGTVDNMVTDLSHLPQFRRIDKARQDSMDRANKPFLSLNQWSKP
jgi:hypothetical protein